MEKLTSKSEEDTVCFLLGRWRGKIIIEKEIYKSQCGQKFECIMWDIYFILIIMIIQDNCLKQL